MVMVRKRKQGFLKIFKFFFEVNKNFLSFKKEILFKLKICQFLYEFKDFNFFYSSFSIFRVIMIYLQFYILKEVYGLNFGCQDGKYLNRQILQ